VAGIKIRDWAVNGLRLRDFRFQIGCGPVSVLQIKSGKKDIPGILTIDAGIKGIQIKYASGETTPGAPEYIQFQIDVKMLPFRLIITTGTRDIVFDGSKLWLRNTDQWDNIRHADPYHIASFQGDA
jgi:hypothetical protein